MNSERFGITPEQAPKAAQTFELSKTNLLDSLYSILLATGKIQGNETITDININNKWLDDVEIIRIKTKKETLH